MTTDAEKALKAIEGIDAARRVGWGRAFSAEAERDLAVDLLREMTASASFFHGMFAAVFGSKHGRVVEKHMPEAKTMFHPVARLDEASFDLGRSLGASVVADDEFLGVVRAANKKNNLGYEQGQIYGVALVAGHFGFGSVDEMFDVLAKWQSATGRPSRRVKTKEKARSAKAMLRLWQASDHTTEDT